MSELSHAPERTIPLNRAVMALIGAAAAVSLWALGEFVPSETHDRLKLALLAGVGGFAAILLGMSGPVAIRRAVLPAAVLSALATLLLLWASLRYDHIRDFLRSGHVMVAWVFLISVPVPFLMAHLRDGEHLRDYRALFSHAWEIVVRYMVAWAFTGLFWGLLFLSDALLKVVGLDVIEWLIDIDPVPWVLTGAVLGLALAVVHELRDYVSPHLVLRLLRLLLPLVLVVVAVFVIAAPLRGLSNLFGSISAAGTLMAMAVAAATLVTATLDRSVDEAATARPLRLSARGMALLMPVLGGLATWAVILRVQQYGWTPDRLAAAVSAGVVLAYGGAYAGAALRAGWQDHIRQANIVMALGMVGLAALWLTPLLAPERIATNSQIARYQAGQVGADELDLWSIAREWGRAGQAGMDRLRALDDPALADNLMRLGEADTRWAYRPTRDSTDTLDRSPAILAELHALMVVRPKGATLPPDAFLNHPQVGLWRAGCDRTTPAGLPGCLAYVGDFLPYQEGLEVMVLWLADTGHVSVASWSAQGAREFVLGDRPDRLGHDPALLDNLASGAGDFGPGPVNALTIDGQILGLYP